MTISVSKVNRIMKKKYGSPMEVKQVFYLSDENKKHRVDFYKKILESGLEGKNIFFTHEYKKIIPQLLEKKESS